MPPNVHQCVGGQAAPPYVTDPDRPDRTPVAGACPTCGVWRLPVNRDGRVRKHDKHVIDERAQLEFERMKQV